MQVKKWLQIRCWVSNHESFLSSLITGWDLYLLFRPHRLFWGITWIFGHVCNVCNKLSFSLKINQIDASFFAGFYKQRQNLWEEGPFPSQGNSPSPDFLRLKTKRSRECLLPRESKSSPMCNLFLVFVSQTLKSLLCSLSSFHLCWRRQSSLPAFMCLRFWNKGGNLKTELKAATCEGKVLFSRFIVCYSWFIFVLQIIGWEYIFWTFR